MKLKFIFLFFILSMTIQAWATAARFIVKFSNNTHDDIPLVFEGERGGNYLCNRNTSFVIPAGQQTEQHVCFAYRAPPIGQDAYAYIFNFHHEHDRNQIIRFSADEYYNFRIYNSWTTYKVVTGYFDEDCFECAYNDTIKITIPINFESK